jgi:hypothetical protein
MNAKTNRKHLARAVDLRTIIIDIWLRNIHVFVIVITSIMENQYVKVLAFI